MCYQMLPSTGNGKASPAVFLVKWTFLRPLGGGNYLQKGAMWTLKPTQELEPKSSVHMNTSGRGRTIPEEAPRCGQKGIHCSLHLRRQEEGEVEKPFQACLLVLVCL